MDFDSRVTAVLALVEEAEQVTELEDHWKQWRKNQRAMGKAQVAKDRAGGKTKEYYPLVMKTIRGLANIDKNQTSGDQIIAYVSEVDGVKRVVDALIKALGSKPKGEYPVTAPKVGDDRNLWFEEGGKDMVYVSYSWEYRLSDNSIRKTKDGKRIIGLQILVH